MLGWMNRNLRWGLVGLGLAILILGICLSWLAYVAQHTPFVEPPYCQTNACPSGGGDFGLLSYQQAFALGLDMIVAGLVMAPVFAWVGGRGHVPTRYEEAVIAERVERALRRND